ncbi:MAG: DUF1080 domain-containing protein [Petrimonas sp.]|jgi:hypothetical protein|nr:DUF1080 domain-containing protein [Dysgonamonadaceae bacterium]MEA4995077.1 DUF1080 domain-containing protein [Petrimonas sp.]MDD3308959.1 DUF1080 domain-containing protein [Dysgonamonadaceae bacterium]MDD3900813.1 DUF1080 domain-containing protein [Dysgonamonadaceae bacterium]MDD4398071.1 DUF1080 domain-containing protein [Dysgonamonadaceae bacterium]
MNKIYIFALLPLFFGLSCNSSKTQVQRADGVQQMNEEQIKPFKLSRNEKKEGFKILFDGTSMELWTSNANEYKLENGCIVMRPSEGGYSNLYSKNTYDNFVLKFDFLLTPGSNSGLGLRHKIVNSKSGYDGMELQILDNSADIYKDLKPYQYHGSIYGWIPAKRGFLNPVGEWNHQEVIANGDNIKVILNGTIIVDGNLKEAIEKVTPDKVPESLFYRIGHIAFLGHDSVIKLKNIRIKEL